MAVSLVSSTVFRVLDGTGAGPVPYTPIFRPAILAPYQPADIPPAPPPVLDQQPVDVAPALPDPGSPDAPLSVMGVQLQGGSKGFTDPIRGLFPARTGGAAMPMGTDPLQRTGLGGAPVWAWVGIVVLLILLLS